MNNNIKRFMKKTKENWIGEQSCETEENLKKNNRKRAYQFVRLDHCEKKGKLLLSKIVQKNASQKNDRYRTDRQNTVLSCTTTRLMY